MNAGPDRPYGRYYSPSFVLRLLALLAFIAALCVAEGWLTKGTWQEWIAGGLSLYVLAELV
jgi:hypothetical protein